MMTRLTSTHRGRAVLIRRLDALEKWRERHPAASPVLLLNPQLLTSDLLEKLVSVGKWIEAHGEDALRDDHRVILNDVSEFCRSLEAQGVDIYSHRSQASA